MEEVEMILKLTKKVLSGALINKKEALVLASVKEKDLLFLLAGADQIRQKYDGNQLDICSIVNSRSGRCTEDCRYCTQSKYHQTDVAVYPLIPSEEIVSKAKEAEVHGAGRFAIVTSGKGMEGDREFPKILDAVRLILAETSLSVCCSLGALTADTAKELKDAGVTRYHHNIETSQNNYRNVCTTHTYEDRIETILLAKEAGLEVCSGGIIGMGETMEDRIEMAFALRQLGVESIPLNILTAVKGTAFADKEELSPWEILKIFALFKFIVPSCRIRTAGGREIHLRDLQANALLSGISGMMIGGYLTTGGRSYREDEQMFRDIQRAAE